MNNANIKPAIIAGSGLLTMPELLIDEAVTVDTPWGEPSGPVYRGRLNGVEVLFMTRHGDTHAIPPHKVNYRANIAALAQMGASHLLAYNAVGGIGADCAAGSLLVADQIIDYTWGREHTYYDGGEGGVEHIDFTSPYDEALRQVLIDAADSGGVTIISQGVYGATQGPRLESAAEITRMARDGCHVVGMTGMPEVALAREKNLPYASLSLVVNPAAGKASGPISMADIEQILDERIPVVRGIISRACALVSALPRATC
ncbi:MAG: S-methyl-5'-thioinosine phosphorylase [Gammaproteobacteria bacterium]|nr:S-methyl-5'-thioinosine phosphorylase [Gammaproteobacteria bacterium]MBQ0840373.1 S-methyl-5'-thioinosine phosphorylase [Gammaproteobacteria bacterium]